MSAPDRIWIDGAVNANVWAEQKTDCTLSGVAAYEYVRADLCDPTQDERVRALEDGVDALTHALYLLPSNCGQRAGMEGALRRMRAAIRSLEQGEG